MDLLVKMQFGSHVYGTNVPTSDLDYKAVYIPDARDIVLQRVKPTIVQGTKEDKNSRNTKDDIDLEIFSLQQYLRLLMEGQTVAIDMLFTPRSFYQDKPNHIWEEIVANKSKFIHSGYSAFAGYCRTQANKYGIKGSRVNALRTIIGMLQACPFHHVKLMDLEFLQKGELPPNDHTKIVMINGPKGTPEPHLEVCNRKVPFHATVKYALSIFQRIFDEYGQRALQAEKQEGIDWKALMHAVRVCKQSKELLTTGNITFPRPEAPLLLKIRKGELQYQTVAEIIEVGLEEMEAAAKLSTLQKEPDIKFSEELIYNAYSSKVSFEKWCEDVDKHGPDPIC
jgi:hypothetical protein